MRKTKKKDIVKSLINKAKKRDDKAAKKPDTSDEFNATKDNMNVTYELRERKVYDLVRTTRYTNEQGNKNIGSEIILSETYLDSHRLRRILSAFKLLDKKEGHNVKLDKAVRELLEKK